MLNTSPANLTGRTTLAGLEKKLAGRDPDDSAIPAPVRKAVRFMLGGGAVTLLLGVFWVVVAVADKNAFTNSNGKKLTNGQFAGGVVETLLLQFLLPAAIWVLMARNNRSGRGWARIVSSVLCAIDTYLTYGLINSLRGGETLTVADLVYVVLTLVGWIFGVVAIAFVWRQESSEYFKARAARELGARGSIKILLELCKNLVGGYPCDLRGSCCFMWHHP